MPSGEFLSSGPADRLGLRELASPLASRTGYRRRRGVDEKMGDRQPHAHTFVGCDVPPALPQEKACTELRGERL